MNITDTGGILQHAGSQSLLQSIAGTGDEVENWLAKLILLNDVPFNNLVADTRLLPNESLRFFYIDPSWLNAMLDGALSISNNTLLETQFTAIMAQTLRDTGSVTAQKMRAKLLGLTANADAGPVPHNLLSGLMLRSAIVSNWPQLKIIPQYPTGLNISPVPLRYDIIGDNLILVIFPGVPLSITIQQPPHGLQFGFGEKDDTSITVLPRSIGFDNPATSGNQLSFSIDIPFSTGNNPLLRSNNKNVVDIKTLAATIQTQMQNNNAFPKDGEQISPSEFIMQVINSPERAIYTKSLTQNTDGN
jgi:hypothetical protein